MGDPVKDSITNIDYDMAERKVATEVRAQTFAYREVDFVCPMHISVDCVFRVFRSIMVVITHANGNS